MVSFQNGLQSRFNTRQKFLTVSMAILSIDYIAFIRVNNEIGETSADGLSKTCSTAKENQLQTANRWLQHCLVQTVPSRDGRAP